MCGIIGIVSREPVAERLVDALKRLEYRGYDSAGVATIEDGKLTRLRAEGKLINLQKKLKAEPRAGTTGIGHTRWATHGAPTETNAHPHFAGGIGVVHNGIIENFGEIKRELTVEGIRFETQTDTEVVVQLLAKLRKEGLSHRHAMQAMLERVTGAYALAVIFEDLPDTVMGARNGPPLAIGAGESEMFLGSDAIALSPFTDEVRYLEDGDWVVLTRQDAEIMDAEGNPVERPIISATGKAHYVDKGNYRHFMQKEIYEQPEVLSHTLGAFVDMTTGRTRIPEGQALDFSKINRIALSACGTGYYAALVGRYYFERYARIPCDLDVASEFRYRESPLSDVDLAIFVSQSGETADTLASLRYAKGEGLKTAVIVNVEGSTMAREADVVLPTLAGPEIGVASTKAFTCQLMALASLAIRAGVDRGVIAADEELELTRTLAEAPRLAREAIHTEERIEALSREMATKRHALFLGRGFSYPLAMEGALKLKEISYIHAEGYAAGELKHGPIALIDDTMPVVVIAPHDRSFEKTISNVQEVAARGGEIVLLTDESGVASGHVDRSHCIVLPKMAEILTPIIYTIPLQLLAYHTAIQMGTDVDQPRNLAKSVTVE